MNPKLRFVATAIIYAIGVVSWWMLIQSAWSGRFGFIVGALVISSAVPMIFLLKYWLIPRFIGELMTAFRPAREEVKE